MKNTKRQRNVRTRKLTMETLEGRRMLAGDIGMYASNAAPDSVVVFDAETDTVISSISLGAGNGIAAGDVEITSDGSLGFVTDFRSQVWAVDLTATPPVLANNGNPIPISNFGEDITQSADGKYLIVSDGGAIQPLSVIDIATFSEVSTFDVLGRHNSVEVGSDGSVFVTSTNRVMARLTLDDAGTLSDTGDRFSFFGQLLPNNVDIAPNGETGVAVMYGRFRNLQSFQSDGLSPVNTRSLSGNGLAVAISPSGDRVYVRTSSTVDVFEFDQTTGELSNTPILVIQAGAANSFYGMDTISINPDGDKLYVPDYRSGVVNVFDPTTGALLTTLFSSSDLQPTGIDIKTQVPTNVPPEANADTATTAEDSAVLIDVAANDFDADGNLDVTTTVVASGPANGVVFNNGDGTITYTPNPDFHGTDSFTYEISDTAGETDSATVTISILSVADIVDDAATLDEDTSANIDVLANDTFEDATAEVTSVTQGANGSVVIEADGTVTYTPDPDFNGSDTFSYTVTTANSSTPSNTETATVSVTINSVIDAAIDVKPGNGDEVDPINLKSRGRTPIAILATQTANGEADDFDPLTIDLEAISFAINGVDIDPAKITLEDVDGDGDVDLLLHFLTQDLAQILTPDSVDLVLTAEFGDDGEALGNDLGGSDEIKIVPSKGKGKKK